MDIQIAVPLQFTHAHIKPFHLTLQLVYKRCNPKSYLNIISDMLNQQNWQLGKNAIAQNQRVNIR